VLKINFAPLTDYGILRVAGQEPDPVHILPGASGPLLSARLQHESLLDPGDPRPADQNIFNLALNHLMPVNVR